MDYGRLAEMIYKRRSHRKYESRPLGNDARSMIEKVLGSVKPLYPEIKTCIRFLQRSEVRSLMPWMPNDSIAIYSETKDGYLENAGFMLAQLDLFIQSIGIGACWIGLAGPKTKGAPTEGLEFVILLAIGESKENLRSGTSDYKRKPMNEICDDAECDLLEPVRLAPSSVNSQPWFFSSFDGGFDVYMRLLVRTKGLLRMNRIDVGIALAHLFVTNPDSFNIIRRENAQALPNMEYITTVKI